MAKAARGWSSGGLNTENMVAGPLEGVRILEFAGLGPAPFCGMMLADNGAEVILIDRPVRTRHGDANKDILNRSRKRIVLDLKQPEAVDIVKRLASTVDGVVEGLRPGVMERLGLGPGDLLKENPRLVYGRMTGWGQTGPISALAGHDINYIALSGVLDACGKAGGPPAPPVNMLGDFGGGGMLMAFGMLAGILSARSTGRGQVIDCAMTDGSALLSAMIWTMRAQGRWPGRRGENLLDTGAHFYDTYETADGLFVAVGAIEPQFYKEFCERLGVANDPEFSSQMDRSAWPALKHRVASIFASKTQREWVEIFEGSDACFSPVLSMEEAAAHPHNVSRGTFLEVAGVRQPAPAPRFLATPASLPTMPRPDPVDGRSLVAELGYDTETLSRFEAKGVFGANAELTNAL